MHGSVLTAASLMWYGVGVAINSDPVQLPVVDRGRDYRHCVGAPPSRGTSAGRWGGGAWWAPPRRRRTVAGCRSGSRLPALRRRALVRGDEREAEVVQQRGVH